MILIIQGATDHSSLKIVVDQNQKYLHIITLKNINLNWVENDAVWLLTSIIIILANYESSFGKAFNRANEEFKNK